MAIGTRQFLNLFEGIAHIKAPKIGDELATLPWEKACIPYKQDSLFDFLGGGFRGMSEFKRRLIATPMSVWSWEGNKAWLEAAVSKINTPPPAIVRQVEKTAPTIFSGSTPQLGRYS